LATPFVYFIISLLHHPANVTLFIFTPIAAAKVLLTTALAIEFTSTHVNLQEKEKKKWEIVPSLTFDYTHTHTHTHTVKEELFATPVSLIWTSQHTQRNRKMSGERNTKKAGIDKLHFDFFSIQFWENPIRNGKGGPGGRTVKCQTKY
jgi:hypothetical protein